MVKDPPTGIISPEYAPAYVEPDLEKIRNPDPSKIQVTWVGHSTFLIQVAEINILTDPIWSERASPVSWAGPKRHAQPGIRFENLPKIDLVLVSHTHYDHLDLPTVKRLGNTPHYITPANVPKWFALQGITNTSELAWWKAEQHGTLTIHAVPAQHWSRRKFIGKENDGWGGYMIETPAGQIYFVGDTGYHDSYFKEIGTRFNNIVLALIPIGAYSPREFMRRHHANPAEAVRIHQEVGAKHSIGMHWGTFKLTDEPLAEPPLLLARTLEEQSVPQEQFEVLQLGETRQID